MLDSVILAFYEVLSQAEQAEQAKRKLNFPDAIDVEYRVIDDGKSN